MSDCCDKLNPCTLDTVTDLVSGPAWLKDYKEANHKLIVHIAKLAKFDNDLMAASLSALRQKTITKEATYYDIIKELAILIDRANNNATTYQTLQRNYSD